MDVLNFLTTRTLTKNRCYFLYLQRVKEIFEYDGLEEKRPESISIQSKTYVIKTINDLQLIAFNGSKYIIISRSKSKFIVVLCDSRSRCSDAAVWLKKITNRLIEKDYWCSYEPRNINCDVTIQWTYHIWYSPTKVCAYIHGCPRYSLEGTTSNFRLWPCRPLW